MWNLESDSESSFFVPVNDVVGTFSGHSYSSADNDSEGGHLLGESLEGESMEGESMEGGSMEAENMKG